MEHKFHHFLSGEKSKLKRENVDNVSEAILMDRLVSNAWILSPLNADVFSMTEMGITA